MNKFTNNELEKKLIDACKNGSLEEVRDYVLNNKGLNLDCWVLHTNPLQEACSNNHFDIAQFLIEQGANVNAKTTGDSTAVFFAGVKGSFELLDLLVKNGADINAADYTGRTPLISALFYKKLENAGKLIEIGANIFMTDDLGLAPLDYLLAGSYPKEIEKSMKVFLKILDKIKERYTEPEDLIKFYSNYLNGKQTNIMKSDKPFLDILMAEREKLKLEMAIQKDIRKSVDIEGHSVGTGSKI